MLSSITRSARSQQHKFVGRVAAAPNLRLNLAKLEPRVATTAAPRLCVTSRFFSSADPHSNFQPEPPTAMTADIAEGIQDTTLFYLRYGVSNQRLLALANDKQTPLVQRWQRMMEIYLSTQVYVISGLGYSGDEKGLENYTRHLSDYMTNKCNEEERNTYKRVGNETWRELLATAFDLDLDEIKPLTIVDARNIMHKVSSKMQDPNILLMINKQCSKLPPTDDVEIEMAQKHQVLQQIIVEEVYNGGDPSLVEECGFGKGEKGYAHLQCVMAEYESDPLIGQYAQAAMARIWEAAGLDMSSIAGAGNVRSPPGAPGSPV